MAVELVVGIALVSLLAGLGIGHFLLGGGPVNKARVADLESALDTSQSELAHYKNEVYGEFAATAEKFRALDKSYHDLHQQLAHSSVALCGDAATPLLESHAETSVDLVGEEIVVAEMDETTAATQDAAAEAEDVAAELESTAVESVEGGSVEDESLEVESLEVESAEKVLAVPPIEAVDVSEPASRRESA